ncbi:MAG: serine/threonine protein kinase [Planctomycetes bacterium]|nr:serine/threonine protein kinase [Planctomycetota bacterium]
MAVQSGYLTDEQLGEALKQQKERNRNHDFTPLGEIFVEMGFMTAQALDDLLKKQSMAWKGQRVVGKYRLLDKAGEGSMGSVWKAVHEELGNVVAIKLLPRGVVGDRSLVERFRREARLLATINHTNIVQAFDAGEDDGQPFFVMPFLDGASVGDILRKRRRLGYRTTLSIALQIVRGLEYAHQRGIVHRDLKPDNLFITNDGTLKILDLGLTKLMEGTHESPEIATTRIGMVVGTPFYMSPEQILGDPNLDGRSDIYALGSTMFQMITGEVPFPGEKISLVLKQKVEDDAPDPRKLVGDIPDPLRGLVMRMLSPERSGRPQNCVKLEEEIVDLLEERPISGTLLAPDQIVLGRTERAAKTSVELKIPIEPPGEPEPADGEKPFGGAASTTAIAPLDVPKSDRAKQLTTRRQESAKTAAAPADSAQATPLPAASSLAPANVPSAAPVERGSRGFSGVQVLVLIVLTVLATLAAVKLLENRNPAPNPAPIIPNK